MAMAMRCPNCGRLTLIRASEIGTAGKLVRCPHCAVTWLVRPPGAGRVAEHPPAVRRVPPLIDGELVACRPLGAVPPAGPAAAFVPPQHRQTRRSLLAAAASAVIAGLAAVVLLVPGVSALAGLGHSGEPVAIEAAATRTVVRGGTSAILVEGTLVNRTRTERPAPAVRITVTARDGAVRSWVIRPARDNLAPGGRIAFRSAVAAPGGETATVTLGLEPASGGE
jgi:predicted Zn finger-like uncharacterized protein